MFVAISWLEKNKEKRTAKHVPLTTARSSHVKRELSYRMLFSYITQPHECNSNDDKENRVNERYP
jgi:hypothetical protein